MGKRIPGRNKGMCKPQRQEGPWHEVLAMVGAFLCVFFYMTYGKVAGGGKRAGRGQGVVC